MSKRSPVTSRRQYNNLLGPRPYSMFVGSQYLKTSNGDLSFSSSGSSSPFIDSSSPNRSPSSTLNRPTGKSKRNSSAETLLSGYTRSTHTGCCSVDVNFNSTAGNEYLTTPPYGGNKKKTTSPSKKVAMPPAGPSAKTWIVPKSIKKLPIPGNVFGVHISKSGTCYASVVTDKGERMIQAFDKNGNHLKSFPTKATKAGKPFEPYQIDETPEGHLAVASGNCVTVWSKEGKLITEHGRNMFKFAKCLAVRSTGEIVVTDTDNDAVKIISSSGQQIYRLEGEFNCPVGVAVDSNDYIIVSDWTDKITIFDENNELAQTFGVKGSNAGEMDLPYGVSVDCENNIVVADMWNHRLSVYTPDGQFLKHLASDPGQSVRMPAHISVSPGLTADDYRLAVTDFSANSAKVFTY